MAAQNKIASIINRLCGVALIVMVVSPCANSQSRRSAPSVGFFAAASASQPFGRIADEAGFGYGGKAGFYFLPAPKSAKDISLRLIAEYNKFPGNNSELSDFKFLRGGLELRFAVDHNWQREYYLLIGGGLARVNIDRSNAVGQFRDNSFYFSSGVGVAYMITNRRAIFVELTLADISGKAVRDYQFLQLHVGFGI